MEDDVSNASSDHDYVPKRMSLAKAFYVVFKYMFADIVIYGVVFPLTGTYFANGTATLLGLNGRWELLISVCITFSLLYLSFWVVFYEFGFWKHLLAMEPFYKKFLLVRDLVNICCLFVSLWFLFGTTQEMAASQSIRIYNIGEGVSYFFLKTLFRWAHIDEVHLSNLGLNPPCKEYHIVVSEEGSIIGQVCTPMSDYVLGAAYMFYWATLAASVAKAVYFGTLCTMMRSMEIFLSLKPIFLDDDDYDAKVFGDKYKSVNFEEFHKLSTRSDNRKHKAGIQKKESYSDESLNANVTYFS